MVKSGNFYAHRVLYAFSGTGGDGYGPGTSLTMDATGNLFGTTGFGGANGNGTVFELVNSSGTYSEKVLYSFESPAVDGSGPSGLVMDAAGNLYGTNADGGAYSLGTAFQLVNSSGSYTFIKLCDFWDSRGPFPGDGANPSGNLVMDSNGNLYGTTLAGGQDSFTVHDPGTVFELTNFAGSFGKTVLYSFTGVTGDGFKPSGGVILDGAGNLYGTTTLGGPNGYGSVFKLSNSSGMWTEEILFGFGAFTGDGTRPNSVIMDVAGNLYGTTNSGGYFGVSDCASSGCGVAFELVNSAGVYTEKVLHQFGSFAADGEGAIAGLTMDASGKLYGTTQLGGTDGQGTVFEIDVNATAPQVLLAPGVIQFSPQPRYSTSSPSAVTVTNTGNANLTFGAAAVTLSGTNAADFSLNSDTCSGTSVAPNETCSIGAVFTPSLVGNESASLVFTDNSPNGPQTVALTGTGTGPAVSLAPATLTFSGQLLNTTSPSQTLTLTNTGVAILNVSSLTFSGDFAHASAVPALECGTSVPAGSNCTITVTFTPTGGGTRTGTLIITDNASDSPQTVALTGTGEDFSVAPPSGGSTSATVAPGHTATYSLSVSSLGGLGGTVSFACSGAPPEAGCAVSPGNAPLNGASPANITVSVSTSAATTAPGAAAPRNFMKLPPAPGGAPLMGLLMAAALVLALLTAARRSALRAATLCLLLAAAAWLPSCGGGAPVQTNPGTPAGNYTLTVTATLTSGNSTLTHNITLSLTVQR